jgi:hypothetical protein
MYSTVFFRRACCFLTPHPLHLGTFLIFAAVKDPGAEGRVVDAALDKDCFKTLLAHPGKLIVFSYFYMRTIRLISINPDVWRFRLGCSPTLSDFSSLIFS